MQLSNIVIIVLRLFSLFWAVRGLATSVTFSAYREETGGIGILMPLIYIGAALLAWFLAKPVARLVTPAPDAEVRAGGLSLYELYCFAFTFLGLYAVLSSIDNAISWTYFVSVLGGRPSGDPLSFFFKTPGETVTCVAGLICLFLSGRLAKKLSALHQSQGGM